MIVYVNGRPNDMGKHHSITFSYACAVEMETHKLCASDDHRYQVEYKTSVGNKVLLPGDRLTSRGDVHLTVKLKEVA